MKKRIKKLWIDALRGGMLVDAGSGTEIFRVNTLMGKRTTERWRPAFCPSRYASGPDFTMLIRNLEKKERIGTQRQRKTFQLHRRSNREVSMKPPSEEMSKTVSSEPATKGDVPHFISLGGGVQSSFMTIWAALGKITPMPMAAIFADTQDEPRAVYDYLNYIESELPFPIIRVSKGSLSDAALRVRTSRKTGLNYLKPSLPVFMRRANGDDGMMPRQCTN